MKRQLEKSEPPRAAQFNPNGVLIKGDSNQISAEMRQDWYFVQCNDSIQFNLLSEQIGLGGEIGSHSQSFDLQKTGFCHAIKRAFRHGLFTRDVNSPEVQNEVFFS